MLIWLRNSVGQIGAPDGIVRRDEIQELMTVQALREHIQRENDGVLDEARRQAMAEIEAARVEAQRIVAEAQAHAEQLRANAYEEGMRKAIEDWHERHASQAVDKTRVVREMHAKLADIVTNAVERIVQSEDRGALYQRALRNVQSLTRGASSLKLRVGPHDYEHAQTCIGSIPDLQEAGLHVEIVSDSSLRPGSCIFESDLGVLDASLETQLDGLRAAMERAVRRAVAAEDEAAAAEAAAAEEPGGAAGPDSANAYEGMPHEAE